MKPTFTTARSSMFALPLILAGGMAAAGGLAEPVAPPAPVAPPPVVVAPSADWTGFYAGGQLGFGQIESDALADDESGAVYGVHAGYLYDLGSVVLGAEVDYDASNIEGEAAAAPVDVELDSVARLKFLAGYDAGQFMPYLTAGVARATVSVDGDDDDDDGRFVGLGLAYQLSDSLRVGGEVLRHQFEDFGGGDDIDATTATARVSFQF
ncbi:outer membrane protein [Yoonia sp. SDW83-1]|uniref:outer membrane protein n=1 Tax=Yoonia sp. SDW83-1 TaxID=3366945 RepID=UPI00398C5482